jgi:fucose permease
MMVAALLLGGMGVALIGSVKLPLARRLEIDEARVGGLVSIFPFAMIPIIAAAGFLNDHLGPQVIMIAGSLVFAASLAILALAKRYPEALASVLLLSGGWSLCIVAGNVLTPYAFPADDPNNKTYATNLANVFFGLGAFLTPLTIGFLVRHSSLLRALALLSVVALLPGLLALGADFPALQATDGTGGGSMRLLDDPHLWLLGFALFFYGPLEASLGAWTTTYLVEKGVKEANASTLLSGFWLSFMAARLITAFTLPATMAVQLIVVLAVACIAVLSGMVVAPRRGPAVAMVILAGLAFGPIFPTLMALLLGHFHSSVQGRAVGMFFAIGGIGWTLIPILIGAIARRASVQRGLTATVGAACGLTVVSLGLLWW